MGVGLGIAGGIGIGVGVDVGMVVGVGTITDGEISSNVGFGTRVGV